MGNKETAAHALVFAIKATTGRMKPENAPTIHPSQADIYFAAGLYEGEGSIQMRNRRGNIMVSMGQKDRWVLDWLRDRFGGRVSLCRVNTFPIFHWFVSGSRARGFVMTIDSLLSPRRRAQIRKAMGGA